MEFYALLLLVATSESAENFFVEILMASHMASISLMMVELVDDK